MRAALAILIVVSALPVVQAESLALDFAAPASAGPKVTANDIEWALVSFRGSGALMASESVYEQFLEEQVNLRDSIISPSNNSAWAPVLSNESRMSAFTTALQTATYGTLYIEADSI